MKVIIAYASTGAGHFKAAEAIYFYLKENCPGIEAHLVDIFDKASTFSNFLCLGGYSFLVKRAPLLWRFVFGTTDSIILRKYLRKIIIGLILLNAQRFFRCIIEENPDQVVCTHFFPSLACSRLKTSGKANFRLTTVITDFTVHPLWVARGTDLYITGSKLTKEQLVQEGVAPDIIKDSGIPIHQKFLRIFEREGLCKKLGTSTDKFTVLVITGSFGIGPIEEIVQLLHKDIQLLIVCANNKKLFARLKEKNYSNVLVFGFVNNIQELMAASDLIITKPGGVTISEILAMELTPLFISIIPGQEAGNVSVLKKYGVGLKPQSTQEIRNMVLDFRDHPDKLKSMKENIKKISKPNCLKEILNVVCQGSAGVTC